MACKRSGVRLSYAPPLKISSLLKLLEVYYVTFCSEHYGFLHMADICVF
jgi:hypothetical protein